MMYAQTLTLNSFQEGERHIHTNALEKKMNSFDKNWISRHQRLAVIAKKLPADLMELIALVCQSDPGAGIDDNYPGFPFLLEKSIRDL